MSSGKATCSSPTFFLELSDLFLSKLQPKISSCDKGTIYGKIHLKLLQWAGWKRPKPECWRQTALGSVHGLSRASELVCSLPLTCHTPLPFSSKPRLRRSASFHCPAGKKSPAALQARGDEGRCWPRDPTSLPDVTLPSICCRTAQEQRKARNTPTYLSEKPKSVVLRKAWTAWCGVFGVCLQAWRARCWEQWNFFFCDSSSP